MTRLRIVLVATLVLLAACTSSGVVTSSSRISGKVVFAGTFEVDGPYETTTDSRGNRFQDIAGRVHQETATTRIPMRIGVRFGYDFELIGAPPNSIILLKCVVEHPPMQMPDGSVRTKLVYETAFDSDAQGIVRNGASYHFSEVNELLPGRWTRAYFLGSRRVLYQEFQVTPDVPQSNPSLERP